MKLDDTEWADSDQLPSIDSEYSEGLISGTIDRVGFSWKWYGLKIDGIKIQNTIQYAIDNRISYASGTLNSAQRVSHSSRLHFIFLQASPSCHLLFCVLKYSRGRANQQGLNHMTDNRQAG